jgi:putative peptidoglycan lipid II flippase
MLQRNLRALRALLSRFARTPLRAWPLLQFNVVESSLLYMAAFLMSALLGMVRQILLNAEFGLSDAAGAYYAAFRLPETIGVLISGGALTNALVPIILRVEQRRGEQAARRLVSLTLSTLLCTAAPLAALAALFAPQFVRYILAPGLDPATQALTATLSRIMLLEVLLVVSEAVLVALLVSRGQLLLPIVAIALRNVTLIGGIVAAMYIPGVGIYGPTIGAILDGIIQLAIILPGLRARAYRPSFVWAPADRDLRAVLRLLGPSALSSLVNYAGGIADTAFASIAGRAAALGALQNALLLIGFPIRLLGIAIGQGALPHLAALSLNNDHSAVRQIVRRALAFGCTGAALAAFVLIAIGRPVIRVFFERGAFDAAAGNLTYSMLVVFALGLPCYVATEVLSRAFAARLDTRTPLLVNLLQLALRIALMATLIEPIGVIAVPLAFVISSTVETIVLAMVYFGAVKR